MKETKTKDESNDSEINSSKVDNLILATTHLFDSQKSTADILIKMADDIVNTNAMKNDNNDDHDYNDGGDDDGDDNDNDSCDDSDNDDGDDNGNHQDGLEEEAGPRVRQRLQPEL